MQQNILSNKIKISEIRKEIFDSATNNKSLLKRHPFIMKYGVKFDEEIQKIYNEHVNLDAIVVDKPYWFTSHFVLPVASFTYRANFGTYHLTAGTTTVFQYTSDNDLFKQSCLSGICNTCHDVNMIVFDRINHFYYLQKK